MPNPNRPQYQDTIEETWGQAVADTVLRRYANTADRDADLAGFAPAQLAGQVVTIAASGSLPLLQQHDGAGWRNLPGPLYGYAEKGTDQVMSTLPGNVVGLELPPFTLGAARRVTVAASVQVVKAADTNNLGSIRIVDGASVVAQRDVYLGGGTTGILIVEREYQLSAGSHSLFPQVWVASGGLTVQASGSRFAWMRAVGAGDIGPTAQALPAPGERPERPDHIEPREAP
jgi:hypothetical protein